MSSPETTQHLFGQEVKLLKDAFNTDEALALTIPEVLGRVATAAEEKITPPAGVKKNTRKRRLRAAKELAYDFNVAQLREAMNANMRGPFARVALEELAANEETSDEMPFDTQLMTAAINKNFTGELFYEVIDEDDWDDAAEIEMDIEDWAEEFDEHKRLVEFSETIEDLAKAVYKRQQSMREIFNDRKKEASSYLQNLAWQAESSIRQQVKDVQTMEYVSALAGKGDIDGAIAYAKRHASSSEVKWSLYSIIDNIIFDQVIVAAKAGDIDRAEKLYERVSDERTQQMMRGAIDAIVFDRAAGMAQRNVSAATSYLDSFASSAAAREDMNVIIDHNAIRRAQLVYLHAPWEAVEHITTYTTPNSPQRQKALELMGLRSGGAE